MQGHFHLKYATHSLVRYATTQDIVYSHGNNVLWMVFIVICAYKTEHKVQTFLPIMIITITHRWLYGGGGDDESERHRSLFNE